MTVTRKGAYTIPSVQIALAMRRAAQRKAK
jgi:hypothetical protein